MAANKTRKSQQSVAAFIRSIENDTRRKDCKAVVSMMREITGKRAAMWGGSIIGFGKYHYTYDSGREGDMFVTGLSPRRQNLVLYIVPGFSRYNSLLKTLGKHKTGKSCLYVNKLDDVDMDVLYQLIERSVEHMRAKHRCD